MFNVNITLCVRAQYIKDPCGWSKIKNKLLFGRDKIAWEMDRKESFIDGRREIKKRGKLTSHLFLPPNLHTETFTPPPPHTQWPVL